MRVNDAVKWEKERMAEPVVVDLGPVVYIAETYEPGDAEFLRDKLSRRDQIRRWADVALYVKENNGRRVVWRVVRYN